MSPDIHDAREEAVRESEEGEEDSGDRVLCTHDHAESVPASGSVSNRPAGQREVFSVDSEFHPAVSDRSINHADDHDRTAVSVLDIPEQKRAEGVQ